MEVVKESQIEQSDLSSTSAFKTEEGVFVTWGTRELPSYHELGAQKHNIESETSFFYQDEDFKEFNYKKHDWIDQFYNSRKKYLEGLKHLGDNWIMDGSVQPSENAIESSKVTLEIIKSLLISLDCSLPKILMSPIPDGGISFEIHLNEVLILITIKNNTSISFEYEINEEYHEEENINFLDLASMLLKLISENREYDYSRWRNAL